MENIPNYFNKETTSHRLMLTLETAIRLQVKDIEVIGIETLEKIPTGSKIIIATTHLTDLDVPLATYALGNKLNLIITNQSTQHKLTEDPLENISMHIAGKSNFLPIDYKKKRKIKNPKQIQPSQFHPYA